MIMAAGSFVISVVVAIFLVVVAVVISRGCAVLFIGIFVLIYLN